MGRTDAAYAYDAYAYGAYGRNADASPAPMPARAPRSASRPRLDVVTGAGRQSDQAVSPVFTHCIKVAAVLIALFCAIGLARVAVCGLTASTLNSNAALAGELTTAQEESSNLEVMNSVYGSSTRIRDLAEGYGMTAAEGNVVLDFTEHAPARTASGAAQAE